MPQNHEQQQASPDGDAPVTVAVLCAAVRAGDCERVTAIIAARPELVHMDVADSDEHRAIHHAVKLRNPEMVRILMEAGSDAHNGIYPHRDATTPLVIARDRGYEEITAIILETEEKRRAAGTCLNVTITPENDALRIAVISGNEAESLKLLDSHPDLLHACDRDGRTVLNTAANWGRFRLVRELIKRGANINHANLQGATPLESAALNGGHADRQIAEGCLISAGLLMGAGAALTLRAAVALGDLDIVRRMASEQPERFKPNINQESGLLVAAVSNRRLDMAALLLDLGLDPNDRHRLGNLEDEVYSRGKPLWIAAGESQYEIAQLLCERGADPNASVYASGNPMSRAYNNRDARMKSILYSYGGVIDPVGAALEGDTSAAAQALMLKPDLAERMLWGAACGGDEALVSLCLTKIDLANDDPKWFNILEQPMCIWCYAPHRKFHDMDRAAYPRIFEKLLRKGIDPNLQHSGGYSLLHHAVTCGVTWGQAVITEEERTTFAGLLLKYGAKLDARDGQLLSTPLGWAARWGRTGLVRLFLEHGASVDLPDDEPWASPLAWATTYGHQEIVNLLKQHGRDSLSHLFFDGS